MALRRISALLVTLLSLNAETPPSPTAAQLFADRLQTRFDNIARSLDGVLGVYCIDLTDGRTWSWNGNAVFAQASSIKIPILVELFRQAGQGRVQLSSRLTLTAADAVGGSGSLSEPLRTAQTPLTMTVEELARAMIRDSDNTATNKLIRLLGMEAVNSEMERLGFTSIRLQRVMMDTEAAAAGRENVASPREMARLVEMLFRGRLPGSQAMLDILALPDADFRKTVPRDVRIAAKPGGLVGVHTETGVVFVPGRPFALSVAGVFLGGDANPIPAVVRAAYEYFARMAKSNEYGNGSVR